MNELIQNDPLLAPSIGLRHSQNLGVKVDHCVCTVYIHDFIIHIQEKMMNGMQNTTVLQRHTVESVHMLCQSELLLM